MNVFGANGRGVLTIPMPDGVVRWRVTTAVKSMAADVSENARNTTMTNHDTRNIPGVLVRKTIESRTNGLMSSDASLCFAGHSIMSGLSGLTSNRHVHG